MQTKYRTSRQDRASLENITPGRRAAGAGYLNEPTARCPRCAFPNGVSRLRYIGCIQCGTRTDMTQEIVR
jgi:hypothetical protein